MTCETDRAAINVWSAQTPLWSGGEKGKMTGPHLFFKLRSPCGRPQSGRPRLGGVNTEPGRLSVASTYSVVVSKSIGLIVRFVSASPLTSSDRYIGSTPVSTLALNLAFGVGCTQEMRRATHLAQDGLTPSHLVFALTHASHDRTLIVRPVPLLSRQ